jgi:N-acetylglucosaminyl-diphospho-decaprenol L-rhamnosyltransferase
MDLSVIIVNWNSADYLRACLSSLYRETRGISFEVVVVDNASYDGCEKIIREAFPSARLVESAENLGFARANNLACRYSSGEILLFLNPDTELVGNPLPQLVTHLGTHPSVGAVGVRLLNTDGSVQTSCVQAFPTIWNQLLDFDLLRRWFPTWDLWGTRSLFCLDHQPAEVDAISGACFMVKRSVFEEAGLFGEQYFMYADDLDLSYRIKKAGYSIHCLNHCQVIHHGGKSSAKQGNCFSDVLQRESLGRFFRTTRGRMYSWGYRAATAVIALIRLALVICLMPFRGLGLQGKPAACVLRKWSAILRWAVGFAAWRAPLQAQPAHAPGRGLGPAREPQAQ